MRLHEEIKSFFFRQDAPFAQGMFPGGGFLVFFDSRQWSFGIPQAHPYTAPGLGTSVVWKVQLDYIGAGSSTGFSQTFAILDEFSLSADLLHPEYEHRHRLDLVQRTLEHAAGLGGVRHAVGCIPVDFHGIANTFSLAELNNMMPKLINTVFISTHAAAATSGVYLFDPHTKIRRSVFHHRAYKPKETDSF